MFVAALAAFFPFVGACGSDSGAPEEVVSREDFVQTYVALRVAELRSRNRVISPEDRERILQEHGVTAEALVHFAENHGGDPTFMQGVWGEIENGLEEERSSPSAGRGSEPADSSGAP